MWTLCEEVLPEWCVCVVKSPCECVVDFNPCLLVPADPARNRPILTHSTDPQPPTTRPRHHAPPDPTTRPTEPQTATTAPDPIRATHPQNEPHRATHDPTRTRIHAHTHTHTHDHANDAPVSPTATPHDPKRPHPTQEPHHDQTSHREPQRAYHRATDPVVHNVQKD